ncbi:MAG: archease [bacterium]
MRPPYEIFDHTADIGLRIYGKDLRELFQNAGRGFTDLIVDVSRIPCRIKRNIRVESENALLLDFLKELLYLFDTKALLFSRFEVSTLTDHVLECEAEGDALDFHADSFKTALKAVTHHLFEIKKTKDGFCATVIFDV